ncbi:ABC transporter family protein [Reticulomyxa filosa]|uniref:ABC transporter family protein n=1 Tax=Reticulomyxa filosa TaxID=46433 RepID=X6NMN1_RETFI|nr:ABC transporter family protein [Reticulomyxa filosa]|eukprot:ETO27515.1 ABC transporter family protein [Reticulomyxa filosa]
MWDNWVLREMYPSVESSIAISSHPLPVTKSELAIRQSVTGLLAGLILTIALSFIPVGIVHPVVQERQLQIKHQQLVSGVSIVSYWMGQWVADFLASLPTIALIIMLVYVFDVSSFKGAALGPFLLTNLLFVCSVFPLTYLLSLFFLSPDRAQTAICGLYLSCGLILALVGFFLELFLKQSVWLKFCIHFLLIPSLKYKLLFLCQKNPNIIYIGLKPLSNGSLSYWDYSLFAQSYIFMAVESVCYMGVLLLIEYLSGFPFSIYKPDINISQPMLLDEDVKKERDRIINATVTKEDGTIALKEGETSQDTVNLCGIRKVYGLPGLTPLMCAVQDLWFGIPQGEVFGFLGLKQLKKDYLKIIMSIIEQFIIYYYYCYYYLLLFLCDNKINSVNGAGKTSTLKVLTGETVATSGTAFIYGVPITNQAKCRRMIGYCPQSDALFELLTGYQNLKFYGRIKGLKGKELERQIKVLLGALSLTPYRNQKAGTYSGGNKRKLSTAIAMIGNPPIVFLGWFVFFSFSPSLSWQCVHSNFAREKRKYEPSTGMDPMSRRHMWKFCYSVTNNNVKK